MVELNEKQNVKKEALLVSQIRYTAQMTTMLEVLFYRRLSSTGGALPFRHSKAMRMFMHLLLRWLQMIQILRQAVLQIRNTIVTMSVRLFRSSATTVTQCRNAKSYMLA